VTFAQIFRHWGRLGILGFGGPPAHIAMLRTLCVVDHQWLSADEFEHAIATTGMLPGPASTQLAIYCAWRLRGWRGALLGGVCFIVPGLIMIVALSALFLAHHPSKFLLGAALGSGAVVPAIALTTAAQMMPGSVKQVRADRARLARWGCYLVAGSVTSIVAAQFVVVTLLVCGLVEIVSRRPAAPSVMAGGLLGTAHVAAVGGLGALALVAFKVGALSYGGGFVIIPLMQHDVVSVYHWMTGVQFLNVVALGQITPGPVVLTTAAVGYAVHGVVGSLIATLVAFGPSFLFILGGARHFEALRNNPTAKAFLAGAGPSVIGAIAGSALPLGLLLAHLWQLPLLLAATLWLGWKKGSSVYPLVLAAALGALSATFLPV
jgi:chromate transporter